VVTARATITELDEARGRVTLATVCEVNGKTVVEGEAVVMAAKRPA
jgi:3-hydroxybutyryl-CoA dehydratase